MGADCFITSPAARKKENIQRLDINQNKEKKEPLYVNNGVHRSIKYFFVEETIKQLELYNSKLATVATTLM